MLDPSDINALTGLYKRNSSYFSDEDYNMLAEKAVAVGAPPPEQVNSEFELGSTLKQFVYGGIKGGIGFIDPSTSDKPRNTVEEWAHTIGETAGFLGMFFAPMNLVTKPLGFAADALRMEKTFNAISRADEFINLTMKGKSLPLYAGEKALELVNAGKLSSIGIASAASAAEKLGGVLGGTARMTTLAEQAITGGIRMGAAGAFSSVTLGDGRSLTDYARDAVKSGAYGLAFGGVMDVVPGLMSEVSFLKDESTMQTVFKGIAGAVVNGAPMMIGGGDPYHIAYESLLGAYFGTKAMSWKAFRANANLTSMHEDIFHYGMAPEENEELMQKFKGREDELKEMGQYVRMVGRDRTNRNIIAQAVRNIVGEERWKKYIPGGIGEINKGLFGGTLQYNVGDYIRRNGKNERMRVTEILKDGERVTGYRGVHEDSSVGEIPVTESIEDTERGFTDPKKDNNVEGFEPVTDPARLLPLGTSIPTPEDQKFTSQTEEHSTNDFEPPRVPYSFSNGLKDVVANVFGMDPKEQSQIMNARMDNLETAMLRQAEKMRNEPETARGLQGLLDEYLHLVPNRVKDVTLDDLAPLIPHWNIVRDSINVPHMYYTNENDGILKDYTPSENSKMVLDGAGSIVDTRSPRYALHAVSGSDDGVIVISGYNELKKNKDIEYKGFNQADLKAEDFAKMANQLYDKGYYLFSAGADKPIFLATKFIDNDMTEAQRDAYYQKHLAEMQTLDRNYRVAHEKLIASSGIAPDRYKRIYTNNLLYYERMNLMPYAKAMLSKGMIRDLVSFNKRIQPLVTNFYRVDERLLQHFAHQVDRNHALNMNMILVKDDPKLVENTDGGTTVHWRNIEAFHKAMGIPDGESHTKSFLYGGQGSGLGMHIIKHAEHKATKAMSKAMDEANVGYIARHSGVKQYGNRKAYEMEFDGEKLHFFDTAADGTRFEVPYDQLERHTLDVKDFHISSDIHDDALAHLHGSVSYPKQASYHMSYYESGKEAIDAHMAWILDRFEGEAAHNNYLQNYLDGTVLRNGESMQRIMDNLDRTGVKNIIDAMNSNETIRERVMERILKAQGEIKESISNDIESGEDPEGFIPEGLNGVKRLIASRGGKIPLLYTKDGRKISEQAIARLFVSRLAFPKTNTGGKGIMYMYEPGLAAQINGGDPTVMNTPKDALTEKTFFLGNTKKKMRLEKGAVIDKNNRIKEGATTLEKQWDAWQTAKRLLDEGKLSREDFERVDDATHFTVTRVPMDSFSGMVRLRFAGFTGEEGGHILLHANVKKQLGGADNDIDTAYYFHGLPKEYHMALERARDNFTKYANVLKERSLEKKGAAGAMPAGTAQAKPATEEHRIFFTDSGDLDPELKKSMASMLDPIYRASLGHAVSKGRGKMLPIAVRYVDIMKKVLDTAYENGGTLTLNAGKAKVVLEARDYRMGEDGKMRGTGETLGAYGQNAINSAADAGKEAGMVTPEEMKAVLAASAFKKISVISADGTQVLFDADAQDFNRMNHKTVLSGVKDLIGDGVQSGYDRVKLMDTEVGLYDKFLKTLFGYNKEDRRPYTLGEIAQAAKDVQGKFVTPYNAFIPILAEAKYNDGLIDRVLPNRAKLLKFLKQAQAFSQAHPLIADSILPNGVYNEYKFLEKHLELYSRHFDSREDHLDRVKNLATVKGMREFAQDDDHFQKYLAERLEIWKGQKNYMDLDQMQRKYGEFYDYNKQKVKDALAEYKALNGEAAPKEVRDEIRRKNRKGVNVENRVRFLTDERYQVSDYIISRIQDAASGAFVAREVKRLGITPEDMPFIGSKVKDRNLSADLIKYLKDPKSEHFVSLTDLVKIVKYADYTFHKKEWTTEANQSLDKEGDILQMSQQDATSFANDYRTYLKTITDKVNEARVQRGAPQISYRDMQELYNTMLVSTVLKGGDVRTGQQRFGLDTVPDRTIKRYANIIDDVYSEALKGRDEVDFIGFYNKLDKLIANDPWKVKSDPVNRGNSEVPGLSEGFGGGGKEPPKGPPTETTTGGAMPEEEGVPAAAAKKSERFKEPTPISVLKTVGMDLRGAYFTDPASKLSRKELKIANSFSDFFKANEKFFGSDLNNFIDMLHGIMPGTTYNPNQWTFHDIEGAYNRILDMQNKGTLIDMVAEMFRKEGSLPYVNWATWHKFPVAIAEKLMRDKNAREFTRIPVFDSQGKLNPDAVPKTYMDNKGVRHMVYVDELVPTNVLTNNINHHKWGDSAIVEIQKKAKKLFDEVLPFLNGGMKDPASKVDYSDVVFKAAAYMREADGAANAGDKPRADRAYARLLSLDDVPNEATKWKNLRKRTLHLFEGGKTLELTGEEAMRHVMDGMEKLNTELKTWIQLDDETLKEYFVKDPDGRLNVDETRRNFINALRHTPSRVLPYDAIQAFDYLEQVRLNAEKLAKSHEDLTPEDVMHLGAFKKIDMLREMHPSVNNKMKAEFFINHYENRLNGDKQSFRFTPEQLERSPLAALYKEARRAADIDFKTKDPKGTERGKMLRDLSMYLRNGTSEKGNIPETDLRARLFGQTHYNQYEADLALAQGKTGVVEYYQNKLMNDYRFKETSLMDAWFPHRNFDKDVIKEQLVRLEQQIRTQKSFSKDEREHFESLEDAYRRLIEEDYNPGSTDDGEKYDTQLVKDGVMPMWHVINQKPAALSERLHDIGGYSTHPFEMVNAVMSVMRSGNSKLISTINNDNILKFQAHQMESGAPADYARGWVTYMRQFERQAQNRPSVFTNEMLSDPATKLKWTPAYFFSDHAMLVNSKSRLNRLYRKIYSIDDVSDVEKANFFRKNKREMTKAEETKIRNDRINKLLDFSTDASGEYTPQALKNMENASRVFKRFSQFEAKIEMSALLFHPRFAIANLYGGISNDFIYNGIVPLKEGHDIRYWNGLNEKFKTMDDVRKWFEDVGVLENIILKDTGYDETKVNQKGFDKVTEAASVFLRKTEPWLRREAAMHGYMAAREAFSYLKLDYDAPILIDMARKSVEASQFLYNNYNRPFFMSTNMGKVFTRFKLWGMNSLKMQGDIVDAARYVGAKPGTPEMKRFQRLMMTNIFMAGLAMIFPHTIFQTQMPQPVDSMLSLSQTLFSNDDDATKKRKALFDRGEDPLRDRIAMWTQMPGVSFPFGRVPLALYDLPQTFRALMSNDTHEYAKTTTLNAVPFGRFTRDVLQAYYSPSMAAELLAGIPLHRIDQYYNRSKKARMVSNLIKEERISDDQHQADIDALMRMR